ncbi:MAG: cytochrome c biogenesis protein CcsA [Planctomycetes bacterium]|nr:cytochrome c biogenesis protein CcsA [Planctomycetota bacterium]
MEKVSVVCFLASYVLATVLEFLRLRGSSPASDVAPDSLWQKVVALVTRDPSRRVLMLIATGAGFFAQTMYLRVRGADNNLPPLMASSHDWLLVLAWVVVLLFLFATLLEKELSIGYFVLPVVLLLVTSANFASKATSTFLAGDSPTQVAKRGWTMLHVSTLVIGIAGVLASLILAVMYLMQHRRLKQKAAEQTGVHLPSLAKLGKWNWWSVVVSVPLLTLGMASGVLLGIAAKEQEVAFEFSDPVILGSGAGWLAMVGLFGWLIATNRPAGKQVAMLTVWACAFLLLTVVGLQVLTGSGLQSVHS